MTGQFRFVVVEATRNLNFVHLLQGIISFAVFVGLGIFVGVTASDVIAQEQQLVAAGSHTFVGLPPDGESLPAEQCESLNQVTGVKAAGGISTHQNGSWTPFAGGPELPYVYVSPNSLRVWGVDQTLSGPTIGAELAALQLTTLGQRLQSTADPSVTIVVEEELRTQMAYERLNSMVMIPHQTPDFALAECWMSVDPAAFEIGKDIMGAGFAGAQVQVRAFHEASSLSLSPQAQWERINSLQLWLVAAAVVAALVAVFAFARRSQLAVYTAMGAKRASVASIVLVEALVTIFVALSFAASASFLVIAFVASNGRQSDVILAVGSQLLAGFLAAITLIGFVAWFAAGGKAVTLLKDR